MDTQKQNPQDISTITCPTCRIEQHGEVKRDPEDVRGPNLDEVIGDATPDAPRAVVRKGSCQVCHYNNRDIKADNTCEECFNLLLCEDCKTAHGENKATRNHVVVPIALLENRKDALCELHVELLRCFCCTCSKAVCHVCVSVQHGDHEIKSLGEEFRAGVTAMKQAVEVEEKRLAELRDDEKELAEFKANTVGMEDAIIKEIEDEAERCIDEILKNKEYLKKQAKVYFRVTNELKELSEAMPELLTKLERTINDANQLLEQAKLHPRYVEKLNNIRQQFDGLKQPDYATRRESYRNNVTLLHEAKIKFCPSYLTNLKFGSVRNEGSTILCQSCGYGGKFKCMNKIHICPECKTKMACTCKKAMVKKRGVAQYHRPSFIDEEDY
jgi:hypothetical protein